MRRAERLFRIVSLFRQRAVRTASDLAAALEVSERTIYRDLAHLQGSGVAIDGVAGLGYVADENFELPPLNLSVAELDAVSLGLSFAVQSGDPEIAEGARSALAKIGDAVPKARRADFATSSLRAVPRAIGRAPAIAAELRRSIRLRDVCDIAYAAPDQLPTRRLVRPLMLTAYNDGWTLGAWCDLRQDFRDFRLDRILAVHPTGAHFESEPDRDLRAYLQRRDLGRNTRADAL
jgi:predicted DNA-binding transcriptional regulator YafY